MTAVSDNPLLQSLFYVYRYIIFLTGSILKVAEFV